MKQLQFGSGTYKEEKMTLIDAIDKEVFLSWKYRDTFLNTEEYLRFLGLYINESLISESTIYSIEEDKFLYFLEFLVNMVELLKTKSDVDFNDRSCATIENIPLILEKMNYKLAKENDKILIIKKDADIDTVIQSVPDDIGKLLLEYNDFKIKDDILAKRNILKQIDLYIEKNIKLKGYDSGLENAIGKIINELGVNHPINKKYINYSNNQLIEFYDKCFIMMLHAIRIKEIIAIKDEIKNLSIEV